MIFWKFVVTDDYQTQRDLNDCSQFFTPKCHLDFTIYSDHIINLTGLSYHFSQNYIICDFWESQNIWTRRNDLLLCLGLENRDARCNLFAIKIRGANWICLHKKTWIFLLRHFHLFRLLYLLIFILLIILFRLVDVFIQIHWSRS